MSIRTILLVFLSVISCLGAGTPLIVFVAGEFEYDSKTTLPSFAKRLASQYAVEVAVLERPDDTKAQTIPGLEKLEKADLVVMMVRRMILPEAELGQFKRYVDSGKPLIGLRTSSHAFENWKEFDKTVLGGNYQGHHGNRFKTTVSVIPEAREHPIVRGVSGFVSEGSLYKNTPLNDKTAPLMLGTIEGQRPEPVAWTHQYRQGFRVFYTSLGHPDDFKEPAFLAMLHNSIEWALDRPLVKRSR